MPTTEPPWSVMSHDAPSSTRHSVDHFVLHSMQKHSAGRDHLDYRPLSEISNGIKGVSFTDLRDTVEAMREAGVIERRLGRHGQGWHVVERCRCRETADDIARAREEGEPPWRRDLPAHAALRELAGCEDTFGDLITATASRVRTLFPITGGLAHSDNPQESGQKVDVPPMGQDIGGNALLRDLASPVRPVDNLGMTDPRVQDRLTPCVSTAEHPIRDASERNSHRSASSSLSAEASEHDGAQGGGLPGGGATRLVGRSVVRGRRPARVYSPDSAMGLATHFDTEMGGVPGWATNKQVLAANIRRWFQAGFTPEEIRLAIELFAMDQRQGGTPGEVPWKAFVSKRSMYLAHAQRSQLGQRREGVRWA